MDESTIYGRWFTEGWQKIGIRLTPYGVNVVERQFTDGWQMVIDVLKIVEKDSWQITDGWQHRLVDIVDMMVVWWVTDCGKKSEKEDWQHDVVPSCDSWAGLPPSLRPILDISEQSTLHIKGE